MADGRSAGDRSGGTLVGIESGTQDGTETALSPSIKALVPQSGPELPSPSDEQLRPSLGLSTSTSGDVENGGKAKRMNLAALRTTTMFEPRDAAQQNRYKAVKDWTIPRSKGGRTPRAATLFLGKDVERWQRHERERMDASGSAGLRVAWRAGASSTIQVGSSGGGSPFFDDGDDDEDDTLSDSTFDSDRDSDTVFSFGDSSDIKMPSSRSQNNSRRNSTRRRSGSRSSRSQNKSFPRVIQTQQGHQGSRRSSFSRGGSSPTGSSYSNDGSTTGSFPSRPRRFSSNGPEAAFLRHETVIGIHTPHHRESLSSSNGSVSSNFDRIALFPLSQINSSIARKASLVSPVSHGRSPSGGASPSHTKSLKPNSSSECLAQAANAAAQAASLKRREETSLAIADIEIGSVEDGDADCVGPSTHKPNRQSPTTTPVQHQRYSSSPARALKLAKRRRPIRIEGTLYDRSGPFREGAVTDGLCVRFFSVEDANESAEQSRGKSAHATREFASPRIKATGTDDAVADEEMMPKTYLITTPDNRVSSAAKLRRWAMDGEGNFYAAMEIKSIEAKMRAADPNMTGPSGGVPKALLRELRGRYLDDLLDEVQKAETLNPDRAAVAHVVCTSDNKFLRLEEDYPEEAFFVIAGCEEHELQPVVSLVFSAAIRAITDFHSAGWLHGDIKLENLMFDGQGRLVVIDYENANPFRGIRGGDGRVTLVSYDWIPPEAFPGPHGRRAGPSADLWALGCNVVRAFALRDDVEDGEIREALLGRGQQTFLQYRRTKLISQRKDSSGNPIRRGSDVGIPGSATRPIPTAKDIDLSCLMHDGSTSADVTLDGGSTDADLEQAGWHPRQHLPPSPGPTPQRLLRRFAREAPDLLKLVIARCITELPEERSVEAETECLRFADLLDEEQREIGDKSRLSIGHRAVKTSIDLSGSSWVRPKLDEARRNLGLCDAEGSA